MPPFGFSDRDLFGRLLLLRFFLFESRYLLRCDKAGGRFFLLRFRGGERAGLFQIAIVGEVEHELDQFFAMDRLGEGEFLADDTAEHPFARDERIRQDMPGDLVGFAGGKAILVEEVEQVGYLLPQHAALQIEQHRNHELDKHRHDDTEHEHDQTEADEHVNRLQHGEFPHSGK